MEVMKPPGWMTAGKKRGVEDQGQGLKYSFLFTTHLFSLFGIFTVYINSFKNTFLFFFFKEGRLWSQTVWESGSLSYKLVKLRQITETLQASGFSWMNWILSFCFRWPWPSLSSRDGPITMILGGGSLGWLDHEGGALRIAVSALT